MELGESLCPGFRDMGASFDIANPAGTPAEESRSRGVSESFFSLLIVKLSLRKTLHGSRKVGPLYLTTVLYY